MRDWCSECQFANYGGSQEPCYNCVTAYNKKPSEFTPATDEVRGVGEWIVKQTTIGKEYTICSVCETEFKFKTDKGTLVRLDMRGMAYCPKCGAMMTSTEKEETE